MKQLYILIGLPGCGKSTWAKRFYSEHQDTIIISPDDFRESFNGGKYIFDPKKESFIINNCLEITKKSLKLYKNIILDESTLVLTKKQRNELIRRFKNSYTKIIGVIFPFSEYNKSLRMKENRESSPELWAQTFDKMSKIFEKVKTDEKFDKLIHISSFEER